MDHHSQPVAGARSAIGSALKQRRFPTGVTAKHARVGENNLIAEVSG